MKGLRCFTKGLIFVLILSALASAQTEKTPVKMGKIVVINTSVFDDERRGIKKLAQANLNVYSDGRIESVAFNTQVKNVTDEINSLIAQNKPINEAYLKLRKLESELNARNREIQKRVDLFLKPVYAEIEKKIKEFAELKGYSIIIDKSELMFLVKGELDDVTQEFIQFCNDAFDKEKSINK